MSGEPSGAALTTNCAASAITTSAGASDAHRSTAASPALDGIDGIERMNDAPSRDDLELAALLERAYRLALWLQDVDRPAEPEATPAAFAAHVAATELVAVLDEARARMVGAALNPAGRSMPTRSSARPGR